LDIDSNEALRKFPKKKGGTASAGPTGRPPIGGALRKGKSMGGPLYQRRDSGESVNGGMRSAKRFGFREIALANSCLGKLPGAGNQKREKKKILMIQLAGRPEAGGLTGGRSYLVDVKNVCASSEKLGQPPLDWDF